jgi:quinol monooxygenase YgiN
MAYVVAATYRAKEGEDEKIREILQIIAPLSRAEPGCLLFHVHRSVDDPRVFFLYEQYTDEGGYQAHMETHHFVEYIRGQAIPRLESRERAFYVTLDTET